MFRTGYNVDVFNPDEISLETGLRCPQLDEVEPGQFECLADQSFREECDINTIIERFGLGGEIPQSIRMPLTGDFTGALSYQESMQLIRQSEEEFMLLPASIRSQFDNDPGKLIAFLDDERNKEKAIELGIVAKPVEKTRDVVQAVDELRDVLKPKAG